jgi:RNA polymerase sigma-70 factor, ECF subfamily
VLQEAYLRWSRVDRAEVDQPRRYLSRVVTRLSLDALRARHARREAYPGTWLPEPVSWDDPAEHRESLSIAMLHLMERLTPPERAVNVLRTAFDWPYEEYLVANPDKLRRLAPAR